MFPLPPREAAVLGEFARLFDARIVDEPIRPRLTARFDEHRNSSRVFPVAHGAFDEALEALRSVPADESAPQLSFEEAA